ncbi:MAG: hypothetical protein U5K69_01420 [Balneolaceae bacterium]|nr:hypothetical protein [Balneolaceae bacterium]
MQDPTYDGSVNFSARLEGTGLAPSDQYWDFRLEIDDSQIRRTGTFPGYNGGPNQ